MGDLHPDFVHGFTTLFGGRTDAYGTEGGGCTREQVTPELWERHLQGEEGVGIYPMFTDGIDWYVRWGCVDLDVKADHKRRWDYENSEEAWVAALNLHAVLAALNITAWIECTKSGGFHVWVFVNERVPAASMRRCLLVACNVADVPPTEVNPKNEAFETATTLGNYVRLPYFGAADGRMNRPILDPLTRIPYGWIEFVDEAMHHRTRYNEIATVAALWRPPAPPSINRAARSTTRHTNHDLGTMSRRLKAIVDNGPLKQEDRSGWLYYVARLCADDGLSMAEACEVVALCDELHTHKFTSRADGHERIVRTVEKAYS
jgi:hypothetical protein